MTIVVMLTLEQSEQVQPVIEAARVAAKDGAPGICFAQVYDDHLAVGFMPHDRAQAFFAAIGMTPDKRTLHAYDRNDSPQIPADCD